MFPAEIDQLPTDYVRSLGTVFAQFGTDPQYAVLQEATTTRYPSYTAFHGAWSQAR